MRCAWCDKEHNNNERGIFRHPGQFKFERVPSGWLFCRTGKDSRDPEGVLVCSAECAEKLAAYECSERRKTCEHHSGYSGTCYERREARCLNCGCLCRIEDLPSTTPFGPPDYKLHPITEQP